MNYGLYLSATGVMTNAYRQDVIANNLANSETIGFKKDLALFQERPTARQEMGLGREASNAILEKLGGGLLASPTAVDISQGEIDPVENPLDVAIAGKGFFTVRSSDGIRYTRNGNFTINRLGHLAMTNSEEAEILDDKNAPITLPSQDDVQITKQGEISQGGAYIARLGVVDVDHPKLLHKEGGTMMSYPDADVHRADGEVLQRYTERSNVDSATEMASLMETQRQLEANANMIRTQDEMMQQLVSVGKIS